MAACLICLNRTKGSAEYHPACIKRLFGTDQFPELQFELSELYAVAAQMAGKMSISGVQEKVSLRLSSDKSKLEVAENGGRYILKPEPARFSALPQNEHATMCLASAVGIETPPFGLMRLKDGSLAYIIKRFDRLDDGTKLQVEDFCQLAEKPKLDKYDGSAELCVRILRDYATEPLVEIRKLYQTLLFGWWVANGDMHLKNFSLLTLQDKTRQLAPAYDLVCTRLAIPKDDSVAMTIRGRKRKINQQNWFEFAEYCELPRRVAQRLVSQQVDALRVSTELIHRSYISDKHKKQYETIIHDHSSVLQPTSNRSAE